MLAYGICFSLSDLLHSVGQTLTPSTSLKKTWHIYTMEYYSAIKRNEMELFVVSKRLLSNYYVPGTIEDTRGTKPGEARPCSRGILKYRMQRGHKKEWDTAVRTVTP